MISSVVLCGTFLDHYLQRKARAGNPKPEYRLPPMALGSILVPLGLIAFGWSVQAHAHWIVPIGSTALLGFGFVAVSLAASSYLVDAFGIYAASATAAATVLRNVASAVLPLAGPPIREAAAWYRKYDTRLDRTCICSTGASTVDEVWRANARREKERFVALDEMRLDHAHSFCILKTTLSLQGHDLGRHSLPIMIVPLQKKLLFGL